MMYEQLLWESTDRRVTIVGETDRVIGLKLALLTDITSQYWVMLQPSLFRQAIAPTV